MSDKPGWGQLHSHEFKQSAVIGSLTVMRCSCGKVKHVVDMMVPPPPKEEP